MMDMLQVQGGRIVDSAGNTVRLRGTCVGGWMNGEDFIDGYPGCEHGLRATMAEIIGPAKAHFFFERLLDYFFGEEDVAFIKSCGANVVRLPLNYRHFERDETPFHYLEDGFQRLDQAIAWCARSGLYVILDLHAVQGWQNPDWHCDNASRHVLFWQHKQFQDRFVALWEEFARRYQGNPTVAGYNVMNEPVTNAPRGRFGVPYVPDWPAINGVYRRVVSAIRCHRPPAHHFPGRRPVLQPLRGPGSAFCAQPGLLQPQLHPGRLWPGRLPRPDRRRPLGPGRAEPHLPAAQRHGLCPPAQRPAVGGRVRGGLQRPGGGERPTGCAPWTTRSPCSRKAALPGPPGLTKTST